MEGIKPNSSGLSALDGHATGLEGLQPVLARLSDPSHRCQGPELTCLLQALCKQLISATSDTNLVIFTSADRARVTAAQAAAAVVSAELSIGAPERCIASPQSLSSEFAASYHARTSTDVEAPASSQTLPTAAASTNTTPHALAAPSHQQPQHRSTSAAAAMAAAARSEAAASRRPPAGPSKTGSGPPSAATTTAHAPPSSRAAAANAAVSGPPSATREPTDGLAGMVTAGIALLVDHLEHFHYRAKAVALDGLLSLSAVGLGPDRRLDPAGIASLPLPAAGGAGAPCSSAAAVAAAAAAASDSLAVEDPATVADAVQALGGLGLGDWLSLRIVSAGAMPRLLELLTQRTGMNFVPVRQLASQVVHNLARRRNAAVRTALARWRPLPGLVSALDVVLEDSPEIAARLLLVLSDLFPTTCHQIAGALHKLIAKQQQDQAGDTATGAAAPAAAPAKQAPAVQQQNQNAQQQQANEQLGDVVQQEQGQGGKPSGETAADLTGVNYKARAGSLAAAEARGKGRKAKAGAPAAEPPAGASRGAAGATAAAGRPRRGTAVAPAPAPRPAQPDAAAQVVPVAPQVAPPGPAGAAESTSTTHLGLAPDVDVPLEALLMRVTGYYMRLAYNAVLAPAPLPAAAGLRLPSSEAERRECEKALLTQRVEEHRRRRKEAAQLDCCVAALLAAAPMPSCLFEALSYSHSRAFAVLAGPPPLSTSLTSASNGGLWRAQDLLPYALSLLQSLGGGSDSGDGDSATAAARGLGAAAAATSSASSTVVTAASLLLPAIAASGPGTSAAGPLNGGSTPAVSAALDRFWGLEHPRCATQGAAGGAVSECPGPALPNAPYGDKPVTAGLIEQCGPILRVVLERAVQAADALPAAASAAGVAAGENPGPRVDALPLAVLRSVGATFLSVNRAQVAQRVLSFADRIERLTAGLARHTDSPASGVAQARAVLGVVNLWACASAGAARGSRKVAAAAPQQGSQAGTKTTAPKATVGPSGAEEDTAPAALLPSRMQSEDGASADNKPTEPQLRRSARIKRRRDGAAAAPVVQESVAAAAAAGPSSTHEAATVAAAADVKQDRAGAGAVLEKLLETVVDLLALRFADARQLQDVLDLQLRQQQEQLQRQRPDDVDAVASAASSANQGASNCLGAAAAAAASGAAGAWLAAVTSAAAAVAATAPADRARLVVETQALLLQAVALVLPVLDASQVGRLVEAGAVHAAARLVHAAATALPSSSSAAVPAAAPGSGSVEGPFKGDGQVRWNEEPLHGMTAAQALGMLVHLLRVSGAGSYGCGSLQQQPEALAALGGVMLMLPRPAERCAAPALLQLQLPSSGAAGASAGGGALAQGAERSLIVGDDDGQGLEDPTTRAWELLGLMSSGEQPCAGHDVVLQLLGPLVALTHGSSARCAAARAALMGVLMQVLRWNHSKTQRQRLFCQVLALWGPHLKGLLLRLPRMASPIAPPRAAAMPPLAVTAAVADAVEAKAAGACQLARTNSQSTMPYQGSRVGRLSTPMNSVQAPPPHAASGTTYPGQRTPPWGSCAAGTGAAAAPASGSVAGSAVHAPAPAMVAAAPPGSHVISPTRHTTSITGLRTAVPPNPMRSRRGSRLAGGLASPLPLPVPRGACLQADGGDCAGLAAAPPITADADAPRNSVTLDSLCGLLEAVTERLADCEVVRHMHMTGWLRALCHGTHCPEPAVRESCQRSMAAAARALGSGSRPFPPLLLADLEADAELRSQLCALNPGAAALFTRRQEAPLLPPRPGRAGGLPAPGGGQRHSDAAAAVAAAALQPPPSSSSLLRQRSGAMQRAAPAADATGVDADGGGGERIAGSPAAAVATTAGVREPVGLQLPQELELVLLPPEEEQRPAARRGRRRGASASAVRPPSRAGRGSKPATRGAAAAAVVPLEAVEADAPKADKAEGEVAEVAPPASRRTRARKGAATRRVRGAVQQLGEAPAEGGSGSGAEAETGTSGGEGGAAGTAVLAPGPGPLASPMPKRRRVSEQNDGDGSGDEHLSGIAAAALPAEAPTEQLDDGRACPPVLRAALFPAAAGASPTLPASETAPEEQPSAAVRSAGGCGLRSAAAAGCTAEPGADVIPAAAAAARPTLAAERNGALELQLTARELRLATAVKCACVSLESALAARRHDLAAVRVADQAAAAAAAAAATMAVVAAAAAPEAAAASSGAAEDTATAQAAKKKMGRGRAGSSSVHARGGAGAGKQVPVVAAAASVGPPQQQPTQPVAVADEEFLSRTYRGVSKKLNFDDM